MNTTLTSRLLLLPVLLLIIAAKPLVDPPPIDTPSKLSAKEVHDSLQRTLVNRNWILKDEPEPGVIVATLVVRTHSLTVRFTVADNRIAMNYVDSVNLDYAVRRDGTRMIHRKYEGWMFNLSTAISRDLQLLALEKPD